MYVAIKLPNMPLVSADVRADATGRRSRPEVAGCELSAVGRSDDGRIPIMETTEKQRAIEALKTLPDQATMEDAIERLCFIAKIEEGLRQSAAGRLVSHDEVKRQFVS